MIEEREKRKNYEKVGVKNTCQVTAITIHCQEVIVSDTINIKSGTRSAR